MSDVLIIGAGISGLLAANMLRRQGKTVTLLDKARGVGGRMATRRLDDHAFDHGAQYFTARDARFLEWVTQWEAEGIVKKWAQRFPTADGTLNEQDEWRYIGTQGMSNIAKHLAQGLDMHVQQRVIRIDLENQRWAVTTETGNTHTAPALLLTSPVPQSLAMLDAGNFTLPPETRAALEKIEYQPCFAVMALLEKPSQIPAPGGQWMSGEPIAWIADNQQKGISQGYGVTIHAGPEFTRQYFDAGKDRIARLLFEAAGALLGSKVLFYDVQRWRYSQPTVLYPEPCLFLADPAPLVFAGDAFGGPRIEGAALSGMAASMKF